MTIPAQCGSCQKRFKANEKLAGRKVKCPQCGAVLTVPKPPEPESAPLANDLLDEFEIASPPPDETGFATAGVPGGTGRTAATGVKCSSCGASLDAGSVICTECGYNRQTGKKREVVGPERSDGSTIPWLHISLAGGGCILLVVVGIFGYSMFKPQGAVGVGSSGISETPKEFVEVEFGEKDFICESPKGWEVTSGGGREGIPPWTKFESGGASITVRDSLSGTDTGMLWRALNQRSAIERGEAPVDEVHKHREQFTAEDMRNYEESDPKKLDHHLGDALIAEFTAQPLVGSATRGYRATVLFGYHQFNIVCQCTESEWEMLKPAFDHVISSLEPVVDEELLGI